ncbi:MAG TPA: hypothetical protein VMW89_14800 [Desulfatiglandales bacterium]|nr:hypothetical protein [Desulfatiglandales bacterium]
MSAVDVLVLGGPDTGKSHYAGQLLGRLRYNRQGVLKLRPGGADDLNKFEEVLRCLEEGRTAGHTPTETWMGMKCQLETRNGAEVQLEWPDYAGERLDSIVERRILPREWRKSISAAHAWMLFIRPSILKLHEDLLSRPTELNPDQRTLGEHLVKRAGWDDRARYVEMLQMLLFASGQSTFKQISKPRLAVVLSCWDELNEDRTPEKVFQSRMPLLHAFIRSIWSGESWSAWALSSLGRALDPNSRDDEFARRGPENFGYVIPPGSTDQDPDLTSPVAWLLEV